MTDQSYTCGSTETVSGDPCQRKVEHEGDRCWQHPNFKKALLPDHDTKASRNIDFPHDQIWIKNKNAADDDIFADDVEFHKPSMPPPGPDKIEFDYSNSTSDFEFTDNGNLSGKKNPLVEKKEAKSGSLWDKLVGIFR